MAGPKTIDSKSLSVGELFRKPYSYKVPFYQRDYSWTKDEVTAFWDDIISAFEEGNNAEYFMGVIVIAPGSFEKTRLIVDGQQRMTSFSMIFSSISEIWQKKGDQNRSLGVSRDYLGSEDRRTGEIIPKLSLNETNDNAYQQIVLRRDELSSSDRKLWPKTNKLLYESYEILKSNIGTWLDRFDDQESSLVDFEEFISENVNLIEIQVSDDSDAFIIFETLNDRGLDLAVADLVKNYLFSLGGTNLDKFKQSWIEISTLVGRENITQFLRHYWLSFYDLVRERDLYREIKLKIRTKTNALQFITDIRKSADHYSALLNPQHSYWDSFSTIISENLEALLLFRVAQYRPVMIAAMKKLEPQKIEKIIRDLVKISFRYTVITGLSTGNLERIYSNAAIAISNGNVTTAKKVFSELNSAYVDETTFKDNFVTKSIGKANIARYILSKLNNHFEEGDEKEVSDSVHKVTLEHILPQNPSGDWNNSFSNKDEHSTWVSTIGNLTLIEKSINKNIGNVGFTKKKEKAFKKSTLALNAQLTSYDDWNISTIKERAIKLAEAAEECWKVSY